MIPMISYNFTTSSKGLKVRMFFSCPPKRSGGLNRHQLGAQILKFCFFACVHSEFNHFCCMCFSQLVASWCLFNKKMSFNFRQEPFLHTQKKIHRDLHPRSANIRSAKGPFSIHVHRGKGARALPPDQDMHLEPETTSF